MSNLISKDEISIDYEVRYNFLNLMYMYAWEEIKYDYLNYIYSNEYENVDPNIQILNFFIPALIELLDNVISDYTLDLNLMCSQPFL